jgi:hypothetical protein
VGDDTVSGGKMGVSRSAGTQFGGISENFDEIENYFQTHPTGVFFRKWHRDRKNILFLKVLAKRI